MIIQAVKGAFILDLEVINKNEKINALKEILTDLAFESEETLNPNEVLKKNLIMQLANNELKTLSFEFYKDKLLDYFMQQMPAIYPYSLIKNATK